MSQLGIGEEYIRNNTAARRSAAAIEMVEHDAEVAPLEGRQLEQILDRFMSHLYCVDATFISDELLDQLPLPACIGKTRVGGIDLNKPRIRAVLQATLAVAGAPNGFTVGQLTERVRSSSASATASHLSCSRIR